MRTYLKEIVISIIAILVMTVAIASFFKAMKTEKASERDNIYALVPSDVNAMLVINRPGVFSRMVLEKQSFFDLFASRIPEMFLLLIRENQNLQSMILSFHPQGVVCYMPASSKLINSIEKGLQRVFNYSPIVQTQDGIDYYYYPVSGNAFFGYYVHDGIWVGSLSKKLLEETAIQTSEKQTLMPPEMRKLVRNFDINAPLNIIFPTEDMNLQLEQERTIVWRIEDRWLGADLFVSEGDLCGYGFLPYESNITSSMYKAMGDTIARRINNLYPLVTLSFQIDKEEDFVYYTGCTPIP